MARSHKVGRPRKFETVAELQQAIDGYFRECAQEQIPLTVTGLAIALDLTRQGLLYYEGREEFCDAVKKAKSRVERWVEEQLYNPKVRTIGPIFSLKNNFNDWKDKTEVEHSGTVDLEHKITQARERVKDGTDGD